jgi:hypothetical protein
MMTIVIVWAVLSVLVFIGAVIWILVKDIDYAQSFDSFLTEDVGEILFWSLVAAFSWPFIVAGCICVSPFYLVWKVNHTKAKLAKSDEPEPAPVIMPMLMPQTYEDYMERLTGEPML